MNSDCRRSQLIGSLREKGISDQRVLDAMGHIPRELFVRDESQDSAYDDRALAIDAGQTISQPYIVALMTQELQLRGSEKVLEIGTGSGYQAAILSQLCARVVTIERIPELSERARQVLEVLNFTNLEYHVADGTLGCPDQAPYDGIVVTAAAPEVPARLYAQLKIGGRLVIPVGNFDVQELQVIIRGLEKPSTRHVCDCCFVKLIGEQGWPAD